MTKKKDPLYSKCFTYLSKILAHYKAEDRAEARKWSSKLIQLLSELDLL